MRSIETLVKLYPNLTGQEIMEIQAQDRLKDEKEYEETYKEAISLMRDINTNGAYYRGSFGLNQYFYYKYTNAQIEGGVLWCDFEGIIVFMEKDEDYPSSITIKKDLFKRLASDEVNKYERITPEEFNELKDYYSKSIPKFWEPIR
jgi:hypothetical protein